MEREIKFRGLCSDGNWYVGYYVRDYEGLAYITSLDGTETVTVDADTIGQFTGILDKNGKEIYEGDIMQFTDKWEWFKGSYAIKMRFASEEVLLKLQAEYDAEKLETRTVEIPDFYEWGLSGEIQQYWEVVGNIHENSELLTQ